MSLFDRTTQRWVNYDNTDLRQMKGLGRSGVFKDGYDDPTFMTFRLEFGDWGASVLTPEQMTIISQPTNNPSGLIKFWNGTTRITMASQMDYDELPMGLLNLNYWMDFPSMGAAGFNTIHSYSAVTYLQMRNEDTRAKYMDMFIRGIYEIQRDYQYIFKSISGIDKLNEFEPGRGMRLKDAELTVTCEEGLSMKMRTLLELYRKAAWDDVYQRWILPENYRWFKLIIYIFERRTFHGWVADSNNLDVPAAGQFGTAWFDAELPVYAYECSPCEIIIDNMFKGEYASDFSGSEYETTELKIRVKNVKTYYKNSLLQKTNNILIYDLTTFADRQMTQQNTETWNNVNKHIDMRLTKRIINENNEYATFGSTSTDSKPYQWWYNTNVTNMTDYRHYNRRLRNIDLLFDSGSEKTIRTSKSTNTTDTARYVISQQFSDGYITFSDNAQNYISAAVIDVVQSGISALDKASQWLNKLESKMGLRGIQNGELIYDIKNAHYLQEITLEGPRDIPGLADFDLEGPRDVPGLIDVSLGGPRDIPGLIDMVLEGPRQVPPLIDMELEGPRDIPGLEDFDLEGPRDIPGLTDVSLDGPRDIPGLEDFDLEGPRDIPGLTDVSLGGPRDIPGLSNVPLEGPREIPGLTDVSLGGPRDIPGLNNVPLEGPRDIPGLEDFDLEGPRDIPGLNNVPLEGPRDIPGLAEPELEGPRDIPGLSNVPLEGPRDIPGLTDVSLGGPREIPELNNIPLEGPRDIPGLTDVSLGGPRDIPGLNNIPLDGPREIPELENIPLEGPRDIPGLADFDLEGPREIPGLTDVSLGGPREISGLENVPLEGPREINGLYDFDLEGPREIPDMEPIILEGERTVSNIEPVIVEDERIIPGLENVPLEGPRDIPGLLNVDLEGPREIANKLIKVLLEGPRDLSNINLDNTVMIDRAALANMIYSKATHPTKLSDEMILIDETIKHDEQIMLNTLQNSGLYNNRELIETPFDDKNSNQQLLQTGAELATYNEEIKESMLNNIQKLQDILKNTTIEYIERTPDMQMETLEAARTLPLQEMNTLIDSLIDHSSSMNINDSARNIPEMEYTELEDMSTSTINSQPIAQPIDVINNSNNNAMTGILRDIQYNNTLRYRTASADNKTRKTEHAFIDTRYESKHGDLITPVYRPSHIQPTPADVLLGIDAKDLLNSKGDILNAIEIQDRITNDTVMIPKESYKQVVSNINLMGIPRGEISSASFKTLIKIQDAITGAINKTTDMVEMQPINRENNKSSRMVNGEDQRIPRPKISSFEWTELNDTKPTVIL